MKNASRVSFKDQKFIVVACALSFCSMMYEFSIAKTLGRISGNVTMWESLTIGIFIWSVL